MQNHTKLDHEGIDYPSDTYELGVDGDGATHYHSVLGDVVYVVERDRSGEAHHLGGRPITVWLGYVRSERGPWQRHQAVDQPDFASALDSLQEVL